MRRFSNIEVSAARYKITIAKMFAKCADFHAELIHAFNFVYMHSFTRFGVSEVMAHFQTLEFLRLGTELLLLKCLLNSHIFMFWSLYGHTPHSVFG